MTNQELLEQFGPRESMDYDLVIVGGGPAGLSAAIKAKQLATASGKEISVSKGGRPPGSKNKPKEEAAISKPAKSAPKRKK